MSGLNTALLCLLVATGASCNSNVTFDTNIQPFLQTLSDVWVALTDEFPVIKNYTVPILLKTANSLIDSLFPLSPLPKFEEDIWWGDLPREEQDTSIRPFEIKFSPERKQILLQKLAERANFTKPLRNAAFSYGMTSTFLEQILEYWQTKYDFKTREAKLNKYPQFKTNIQGLDIHYYHIKPEATNKTVVPLLMLHGWPITNMEYIHMFPQLISDKEGYDFVFEIIAPSIPGFGYSEGTSKIGLSPYQIAILFKNLMTRIGYKKFYIHAGDFGEFISSAMITIYQDDVMGFHTNFPYSFLPKTLAKFAIGALQPSAVIEEKYEDRLYPVFRFIYYLLRNFGYYHMQATKPDTLGVGLLDSPSGLAAWVLTATSWASNPNNDLLEDGGLLETFDIDDLMDVITIWWDSEAIGTSIRIYAEFSAWFQDTTNVQIIATPTTVPYSCIKFLHEIIYQPDDFIKDKYTNLVHSTTLDFGGHFEAFENTDVLVDDVWKATSKMIEFNNENNRYLENCD